MKQTLINLIESNHEFYGSDVNLSDIISKVNAFGDIENTEDMKKALWSIDIHDDFIYGVYEDITECLEYGDS